MRFDEKIGGVKKKKKFHCFWILKEVILVVEKNIENHFSQFLILKMGLFSLGILNNYFFGLKMVYSFWEY